jgi:hypothetical protein
MIDLFYRLRRPIGSNKILALFNKLLELSLNILYPKFMKIENAVLQQSRVDKTDEIIISLTSFPKRLENLHICITSLINQSLKPNKIVLWLYEGECSLDTIPNNLLRLREYGLEIKFCKENLMPHKKYYYSAIEYPSSIIVTVDDDNFYPTWLIEELYIHHKQSPTSIVCTVSRKINIENSTIQEYNSWNKLPIQADTEENHLRVAIGAGGVLYPPSCMDQEYYNLDVIKSTSLQTDDLWAKFAELRADRMVKVINNNKFYPIAIGNSQIVSLKTKNVGKAVNNVNMEKLTFHYPKVIDILINANKNLV